MNALNSVNDFLESVSRVTGFRFEIGNGSDDDGKADYRMPLKSDDGTMGSLAAYVPCGQKNESDVKTFLNETAGLIEQRLSLQKETEILTEKLCQSFEDLNLHARIAGEMRAIRFSGSRLKDILQDIFETMRVDLAFASLPDRPEYDIFIEHPDLAEKIDSPGHMIKSLLKNIPPPAGLSKDPYYIINDSGDHPDYSALHPDRFRFLAVPMRHNNKLFGWLGMVSFNMKEIFRQSELSLLGSVAEQITVVIANSDLYQEMERFVINVVKSLVHAIEAKDYYTRGHSERVNRYCMILADHMDMEKEERGFLHWASILHDVGKIGIPEIILNKPEGLDEEEYGLIKSHSQKGYDILKPIEQISGSLPGILYHHERYDGKGYPKGLKGHETPLIARIISVVDTFDALTSDRAYRPGISTEVAFEKMAKVSGSQLDPGLLALFRTVHQNDDNPQEPVENGNKYR